MGTKNAVETAREEIERHLELVLASPVFVAQPKYGALLRYLVERSLVDETPHEIDIAVDVFGKDHTYDPAENSSVRVAIHQLRRKLRDYYSEHPQDGGVRFNIPKGSYRVSFGTPIVAPSAAAEPSGKSLRRRLLLAAGAAAFAASLATNLLLLADRLPLRSGNPLEERAIWRDLVEGPEPILIALGDFFFFQEVGTEPGRPRFIRHVDINSVEDLRRYAGDKYGVAVIASEQSYLPKSAAFALEMILPIVAATGKPVSLKLMSDVSVEDLRNHDVIYIGYLRSMGALSAYFFQSSNFSAESPFAELQHKGTGDTFARSGNPFGQAVDYGLFAKMAGPGVGEALIFTGISDIGILHTVRALTDSTDSSEVERMIAESLDGIPEGLEVLFEVSGYDRSDLGAIRIKEFKRPTLSAWNEPTG